MIGLNMVGMWLNARRGDRADQRRMAGRWGWDHPIVVKRWTELRGRIIRPWKWHKVWHSFKHLCVEWTRLEANRAGKLWMDWVVWSFVLGALLF
jgi:hypothetical protein